MSKVDGYQIIGKLTETELFEVFKASGVDGRYYTVFATTENHGPEQCGKSHHAFKVAHSCTSPHVLKVHSIKEFPDQSIMIGEPVEAECLHDFIRNDNHSGVETLFFLAFGLIDAIESIHKEDVLHLGLNPKSILFDEKSGLIRLIDFSRSSQLSNELQDPGQIPSDVYSMGFISPEQTGRMNRQVDYRSDFYSLGSILYYILTGNAPFDKTTSMELVHAHIADRPISPTEDREAIPEVVSEIVLKLLAKNADDRYQSLYGLKQDLQRCQAEWQKSGAIEKFPLGVNDFSSKFQVSNKLYGRFQEVSDLLKLFEQASAGGMCISLIGGYSGVGKTSVVGELHRSIYEQKGHFVSGKFDQFMRNTPYASLSQAFKGLVKELLSKDKEDLDYWKNRIIEAASGQGRILTDLIPGMEILIGEQPEVPDLGPKETQHRMISTIKSFIGCLADVEHPLVLFLDDLQWADPPTLFLLQQILNDQDTKAFYLVGAYRDNEVSASHPFVLMVEALKKNEVAIHEIELLPLKQSDVQRLLADTTHRDDEECQELCTLLFNTTNGNPFFVKQSILRIHEQDGFSFDSANGHWEWSMDHVLSLNLTSNVIELMTSILEELPPKTIDLLKLAAGVGNKVSLSMLTNVSELTKETIQMQLWPALKRGLLFSLGDQYKMGSNSTKEVVFKFMHDRIQQAAYELIPSSELPKFHFNIGKIIWQKSGTMVADGELFNVVNHLNKGLSEIQSDGERIKVAKLNFDAAVKAKQSTAYAPALTYIQVAKELWPAHSWDSIYELTRSIHILWAECEYLNTNFAKAEEIFESILDRSQDKKERAEVCAIQMILLINRGLSQEAVDLAIDCLKLFDIHLVPFPKKEDVHAEILEVQKLLGDRSVDSLIDLAPMEDLDMIAAMKVLFRLGGAAYFTDQNLYALMHAKVVILTLRHGTAPASIRGYAIYGSVLGSDYLQYNHGYEFAQLALKLGDQFNKNDLMALSHFLIGSFSSFWSRPADESLNLLLDAHKYSYEAGNMVYSGFSTGFYVAARWVKGDNLDSLFIDSEKYLELTENIKFLAMSQLIRLTRNSVAALQGQNYSPLSIEEIESSNNKFPLHFHYIAEMKFHYLLGDYSRAEEALAKAEALAEGSKGAHQSVEHYFYETLILINKLHVEGLEEKNVDRVEENLNRFAVWARSCPENFLHRFEVLKGEELRLRQHTDPSAVLKCFDRAVSLAGDQKDYHIAALACELAGRFFKDRQHMVVAEAYIKKAIEKYVEWGATRKAHQLRREYGYEVEEQQIRKASVVDDHHQLNTNERLDVETIVKATHLMLSEFKIDSLISKVMQLVMVNSGAQRGLLMENRDGEWFTAYAVESDDRGNLKQISAEDCQGSRSVVNFVSRTKEYLIIDDAQKNGIIKDEEYFRNGGVRSVLCYPLTHLGDLAWIVYLENNISAGAFVKSRLELLDIVLNQAATLLENARIYETMESMVEERTSQLSEKNEQLEEMLVERRNVFRIVCHDLANPLSLAGAGVSLLEEVLEINTPRLERTVKYIKTATVNMEKILEQVRRMEALSTNKANIQLKEINFFEVLESSKNLFEHKLESKELQLSIVNQTGEESVKINVDEVIFSNVILNNLISNAIKFSHKGSEIEIEILDSVDGRVKIQIKDSGIGMPESLAARIFSASEKTSRKGTSGETGTGFGMPLVKAYVEKFGGTISVLSKDQKEHPDDHGTTFELEFKTAA